MRLLEQHHELLNDMPDSIRKTFVAVDITPASTWFLKESPKEKWDWRNDFPTVVSPWPFAWFEFQHPGQENINGRMMECPNLHHARQGYLVQTIEIPPDKRTEIFNVDPLSGLLEKLAHEKGMQIKTSSEQGVRRRKLDALYISGERCRWMMLVTTLLSARLEFWGCNGMYLDEDGKPFDDVPVAVLDHKMIAAFAKVFNGNQAEVTEAALQSSGAQILPLFFSLSLLHCKNVHIEDVLIPPAVQKKRSKKGIPQITFKTLVVKPLHQQVRRECDSDLAGENNTVKRALHICRGHFKDYRETGLFGKYYGLYWWDMHVRGKAQNGIVNKDYLVKR